MAKTKPPTNGTATSDILTLAEAAAYLKVSEEVLQQEAEAGRIPARQLGDDWRFSKSGIDEWMKSSIPAGPTSQAVPTIRYQSRVDTVIEKMIHARLQSPSDGISATFGIWKDDPTAEDMMKRIEKERM